MPTLAELHPLSRYRPNMPSFDVQTWMLLCYSPLNPVHTTGPALLCVARSRLDWRPLNVNWGPLYQASFRPVEAAHPLVRAYETIRPHILAACAGLDWMSIGLRRLGCQQDDTANPLVLIVIVASGHGDVFVSQAKQVAATLANTLTR